jgi:hypothetical protein
MLLPYLHKLLEQRLQIDLIKISLIAPSATFYYFPQDYNDEISM